MNPNENQPVAPGKQNPSPSSAVADDVEGAQRKAFVTHAATIWEIAQRIERTRGAVINRQLFLDCVIGLLNDFLGKILLSLHSNAAGGLPVSEKDLPVECTAVGPGVNRKSAPPASSEHILQMERELNSLNSLITNFERMQEDEAREKGKSIIAGSEKYWLQSRAWAIINRMRQLLSSQDGNSPATSVESPEVSKLAKQIARWATSIPVLDSRSKELREEMLNYADDLIHEAPPVSGDLERLRLEVKARGEISEALHEITMWCFDLTLTCMTTDGVSDDIRRRARAAHTIMLKYRQQYDLRSRAEVETGQWDLAIDSPNYEAFFPSPVSSVEQK